MNADTQAVVEAIQAMVLDPAVPNMGPHAWLTDGPVDEQPEALSRVVYWAEIAMVTGMGQPIYSAISDLGKAGYLVTKGESDSFRWLSGVLHTPKGRVVFG